MKAQKQTWRDRALYIALIPYAVAILAWGVIVGPRDTREVDDD